LTFCEIIKIDLMIVGGYIIAVNNKGLWETGDTFSGGKEYIVQAVLTYDGPDIT
jgi:hypothetical protein